uniref:class I SAM-dependent methyltransferase n=1 Tax=Ningiella ruwaisensis TaxID=2364274 RepID=UPI00109FEEE0|nr:class I SAM-dependent methyltransferase [Ningiella ruwaisensis]
MLEFDKSLLPPPQFQIMKYTARNFISIGRQHLEAFINEAGLTPESHVLEIGAGNGRIASAVVPFLRNGSYTGVDIMKPFIKWLKSTYHKYPNARFEHINVFNKAYNKFSFRKAKNYKFKYKEASFDFIYLTSVFTHMHSEDIDNYLSEISRMLKPGGKCFITYFLIDEATIKLIDQGKSKRAFKLYRENSYTDNPKNPEVAIAFNKDFVEGLYKKHRLSIEDLYLGRWRNPLELKKLTSNQDHIIAVKNAG